VLAARAGRFAAALRAGAFTTFAAARAAGFGAAFFAGRATLGFAARFATGRPFAAAFFGAAALFGAAGFFAAAGFLAAARVAPFVVFDPAVVFFFAPFAAGDAPRSLPEPAASLFVRSSGARRFVVRACFANPVSPRASCLVR